MAEKPRAEGADEKPEEGELEEVDLEREVIGTHLYRERRVVEEAVEVEVPPEAGRRRRRPRRTRKGPRRARRAREGLRRSLAYKFFFDIVCNRLGLIVIGFATVMILFVMFYDYIHDRPFSLGRQHVLALVVTLVIYAFGFTLEMVRAWSWECEDEAPLAVPRVAADGDGRGEDHKPLPLIPEDAVEELQGRHGR